MNGHIDMSHVLGFARPAILDLITKHLRGRVRILMVVDTEIDLDPGAGSFGIERVIRLLRETGVGRLHFHVDVGVRSSPPFAVVAAPPGTSAKYTGFRFDSTLPDGKKVIDQYDEVWCFGFKPDNAGAADGNINQPFAFPASDAELAALTTWMNKGGGVFATGDHDYLGASMCSRIPRIGTMRAWTNAQGVPPINTAARIDTHRPGNAAEAAGTEVIEFDRQEDAVPQPIEWVPWSSVYHFRHVHHRPHPVLCHPTLGPIDVMPDHAHEGVVFDHVAQPDVGLAPITVGNNYNFAGVNGPEYPTVGGLQPLPMVIAHGRTLADPPLMHQKGDSPAKRFAMISVYDGHLADVGRAAADSTWHHWMNLNIAGIEAAGGDNWEKISRYYLNLAVWLAPRRISRLCLYIHLVESFYAYPGIEEFHPRADTLELGVSFRHYLMRWFGPCWVTQWVLDIADLIDPKLRMRLLERYFTIPWGKRPFPPRPEPCLTCPTPDLLEAHILGGMVRAAAEALRGDGGIEASLGRVRELTPERMDKLFAAGAAQGMKQLQAAYGKAIERTKELLG